MNLPDGCVHSQDLEFGLFYEVWEWRKISYELMAVGKYVRLASPVISNSTAMHWYFGKYTPSFNATLVRGKDYPNPSPNLGSRPWEFKRVFKRNLLLYLDLGATSLGEEMLRSKEFLP